MKKIMIISLLVVLCNITMFSQAKTDKERIKEQITELEVLKEDIITNSRILYTGQAAANVDVMLMYAKISLAALEEKDNIKTLYNELEKNTDELLELAKQAGEENDELIEKYNTLAGEYNKLHNEYNALVDEYNALLE